MQETKLKKMELVYDRIKKRSMDLGMNLSELCVNAGVQRQVLERWRKSNPKSVVLLQKLELTLDSIETERLKIDE